MRSAKAKVYKCCSLNCCSTGEADPGTGTWIPAGPTGEARAPGAPRGLEGLLLIEAAVVAVPEVGRGKTTGGEASLRPDLSVGECGAWWLLLVAARAAMVSSS